MKSHIETVIDARLVSIRDHVRDFIAAYIALVVLGLCVWFSSTTMSPCVRHGSEWAPTAATHGANQYYGFDQPCAAKQMFGMAEPMSTETRALLIGQGIMIWFLGLLSLFGVLVMAIGSGRRNALLRDLASRHAVVIERLVASMPCRILPADDQDN